MHGFYQNSAVSVAFMLVWGSFSVGCYTAKNTCFPSTGASLSHFQLLQLPHDFTLYLCKHFNHPPSTVTCTDGWNAFQCTSFLVQNVPYNYQPAVRDWLVLKLLCVFRVCIFYLCVRTYHMCNNYVTYIVSMRPCLSRLRQFRRIDGCFV